jgi:hypothetical protein
MAGPMFTAPIPLRTGETLEREGFLYGDLHLEAGSAVAEAAAES